MTPSESQANPVKKILSFSALALFIAWVALYLGFLYCGVNMIEFPHWLLIAALAAPCLSTPLCIASMIFDRERRGAFFVILVLNLIVLPFVALAVNGGVLRIN
jgi:hypothetical protein